MKKNKIVIITLVLGILFLTSYLYNSYATSTGLSLGNDENTYDILLNDSTNTVEVPAKSSKTIYYQFSNTNKGTVKYHIGYTSDNVIAKVWWDTEDKISDTIEQGEYKFIKLKLINDTTSDDTITIKPVLGYVNGGDVIPDSNTTLVTGTINETNTMSIAPSTALNTLGIAKSSIEEISFVNDIIVSADALGSTNMNNDGSIKMWYTSSDTDGMYKVYIGSDNGITIFPSSCLQLFVNYTNLISVDFSYIDTSKVTSMHQFFRGCTKLENVSFENFNTTNVNDLSDFFYNCSSLNKVDLTSFETSKVTTMAQMFYQCTNLETVILGTFSNNVLYYVQSMFCGCSKLKNLDLIDFGTSRVTNMNSMFRGCSYLRNINLSNFDTKNVTNMGSMFMNCTRLASVDVSNFNTSKVKMINYMFFGCYTLKNIDLSSFDTSLVTAMDHLFTNSTNLERVNLSNFNMSNVSSITEMFSHNKQLKSIDFSNVDFTSMSVYSKMLNDINNSAIIYVKDNTQKEWIETRFTTLTGVTAIDGS